MNLLYTHCPFLGQLFLQDGCLNLKERIHSLNEIHAVLCLGHKMSLPNSNYNQNQSQSEVNEKHGQKGSMTPYDDYIMYRESHQAAMIQMNEGMNLLNYLFI